MVKANSGIMKVSDLKGKKVVTTTGPIVNLTNLNIAYLHSGGLGLKDITAIKSGTVEYKIEPGAAPEDGSCLTCCTVPKSNITLDA